MKKYIIWLILNMMVLYSWAQEDIIEYDISHTLSSPILITKEYVGRDFVKMTPGFRFSSSGGSVFKEEIDNIIIFPADYASTPVDSSRIFNNKNEVGSLPGSVNVSPNGGANYTIPIKMVPGKNGMVPSVSIGYNSNARNGDLGWKWSLNAESVISRGPTTFLQEGYVDGGDFTANDKFYLDGNRLILHSGTYGADNSEYRTQSESFNKIKQIGSGIATSFKVWTKSGRILYYGSSSDSKVSNGTHNILWYLTKVEDYDGNAIDYNYVSDTYGLRLQSITYAGNSINFLYDERADKNTFYRMGVELSLNLILRQIEVQGQGTTLWTYNFNYTIDTHTKLNEITFKAMGNSQFNSTVVNWNQPELYTVTPELPVIVNSTNKIADFNGDGRSDYIKVTKTSVIFSFANTNETSFTEITKTVGYANAEEVEFSIVDFNNDSFSEVFVYYKIEQTDGTYDYEYRVYSTNGSTITEELSGSENSNKNLKLLPANIDGDDDIEILVSSELDGITKIIGLDSYTGLPTSSIVTDPRVLITDLNSDGKDEVVILEMDLKVFEYKTASNTFDTLLQSNNYDKGTNFEFADFNGDGYLDFLTHKYTELDGVSHSIKYFTGTELVTADCPVQPRDPRVRDFQVYFTGDFNGDGYSDILDTENYIEYEQPMYHNIPSFYIHYGGKNGFTTTLFNPEMFYAGAYNSDYRLLDDYRVSIIDANGDGKDDLFTYFEAQDEFTECHLFQLPTNNYDGFVSSVTNGMNIRTEITYANINQSNCYTENGLTHNNYRTAPKKLIVVDSVKTMYGGTDINETTFNYQNSVFNKYFGFVGFQTFKTSNTMQNRYTERIMQYVGTYSMPTIHKSIATVNGGNKVSETEYTTDFVTFNKIGGFTYSLKNTQTSTLNGLTGVTTTTKYLTHNNYLNPVTINTTVGGSLVKNVTISYSDLTTANRWLIGRPNLVTEVMNHTDDGSKTIKTKYNYNDYRLTSKVDFFNSDMERTTAFTYTGDLISGKTVSAPSVTRTETYEWDGTGRFINSVTNNLEHTAYMNHDTYTGAVTSTIDANGLKTQYEYNAMGALIKTTAPNGLVVQSSTEFSNKIVNDVYKSVTTSTGLPNGTTYFNCIGQNIESKTLNNQGKTIKVTTVYNTNHSVKTKSLPYTSTAINNEYTYDNYGRITYHTLADGTGTVTYSYSGLTTTVTSPQGTTTTVTDDAGFVKSSETDAGTVNYTYYSNGLVKTATAAGGVINYEYDAQGHNTKTIDPDAGTHLNTFNGLGELTYTNDPNNYEYTYGYDAIGRVITRTGYENTTWQYDPLGNIGTLNKITVNGETKEEYQYNTYGQITQSTQYITHSNGNRNYTFNYVYDELYRLQKLIYPQGYEVNYNYNNGFLDEVTDNTGTFSWSNPTYNDLGMPTTFALGNGADGNFTYDDHFMPNERKYGSVVNWDFDFTAIGNLEKRKKDTANVNALEKFGYDTQNRLAHSSITGNITYNSEHSIENKSDIGDYNYTSNHALETVDASNTDYSPPAQNVFFNNFKKIAYIVNLNNYNEQMTAEFTYGPNRNRTVMEVKRDGYGYYTKYYASKLFEEKVDTYGSSSFYNYVYVQGELIGINIQGNINEAYYVHTDYLGSIVALTDQSGDIAEEYAYDAWGKRKDPNNWSQSDTRTNLICDRGFTGHEHLTEFGLINMNGRVYDQAVGMFLSPDPILQSPGNALNYNRYSYVLNNPLKYTDPSGYQYTKKISQYPDFTQPSGSSWHSGGGTSGGCASGGGGSGGGGYRPPGTNMEENGTTSGDYHKYYTDVVSYNIDLDFDKYMGIGGGAGMDLVYTGEVGFHVIVNLDNNSVTHAQFNIYKLVASNEGGDLSTNFMASLGFTGTVATSKKAFNVVNNEVMRQQVFNNSIRAKGQPKLDVVPFKVPTALKIAGKYGGWVFTIYGAYDINNQWTNNQISTGTMAVEQVSNGIGAIPVVGTGWSIGWNLGKVIGPSTWYGNNDYKWFE